MADQWVILELSSKADNEDPDIIRKAITYTLKGSDVFIPAIVTQQGDSKVIKYLVEGYAFIRHKQESPLSYYSKLENSRFVQSVLTRSTGGGTKRASKMLALASDAEIEKIKRQMQSEADQGINEGDTVFITSGAYKQLTAKVIADIPEEDKVQVHIQLRSKDSIVTLPRSFLRLEEKSPRLLVLENFDIAKAWFNDSVSALRTYLWEPNTDPLRAALQKFNTLNTWAVNSPLIEWESQWISIDHGGSLLPKKTAQLAWLEDFQRRLDAIRDNVLKIERQLDGKSMYDNILVDGLNLAFRAKYAPGISQLTDSSGRPTGLIFGFLRSLAALAKRFPGAKFTVCWDGSSRARKVVYSDYKVNQPSGPIAPEASFQLDWLRANLGSLGIHQSYNPEEEADDVIASLVRGSFKDATNLILSSDRDLLQLVTDTTHLLAPAQGGNEETIYDPETLKSSKKWGVYPHQMVAFRALKGDTSDDIPGVPRVPAKVLRNLVELYGTIDKIYSANLTGLTKLQYDNIKAAENQVRTNLILVNLRTIPYNFLPGNINLDHATTALQDVSIAESVIKPFM